MCFKSYEKEHLSFLISMKSVSCDFLFGLAVDVIKISIRCRVDTMRWRGGGKNIISMAQFYLLTGTMTLFLRKGIRRLLMEMKSHKHKSRLQIDQLVEPLKLHRLLEQYSITR